MKITLYYRNGNIRELSEPWGMRDTDGSRAYKAVLDKDAWHKEFVRNKVALSLHPIDCEGVSCD